MSTSENILELAYGKERQNYQLDDQSLRVQKTWFDNSTVDYWRHHRMMSPIKPLLDQFKNSKWLTLGDGRFGLDSIRLKNIQPELEVLPTDITITLLKLAKERGLIADYGEENAEALSFKDNSFDFCLCKESYHHFPRAFVALYEMLRVAKEGVILIEPNDRRDKMIPERIINSFKKFVKKIIGKPILHPETWNFEDGGNFIYTVGRNEIEKLGIGLQLPAVAFHYFNDYYQTGVEFEKAEAGNKIFKKVKRKIRKENLKCELGLQTYSGITVILFINPPLPSLQKSLTAEGFEIVDLPVNPHLKK